VRGGEGYRLKVARCWCNSQEATSGSCIARRSEFQLRLKLWREALGDRKRTNSPSSSSSLLFPLVSGSAFFHAKESCIDHPSFHYFTREKKVNRKRRPEKGEDRFGTRSRSRACMYSVVSGGGAKERGESERMTGMVEEKKVKIESACISTALNEKGEETEDAQTTTQIPYR
jgi:hypothetical protein